MRVKSQFVVRIDKAPSGRHRWAVCFTGGDTVASGTERNHRLARYASRLAKSRLLKETATR